jgi:hypothetical protein
MPKTSKKTPKSDFIRAQPATMSASDVVAKAKAQKLKISRALVYMVRGSSKTKPRPFATTSGVTTSKATSPTPSKSKAAFIRSLPTTMSAKDVVATGKAKGIKFDVTYVYSARRPSKGSAPKKRAAVARPGRTSASVPRPMTTTSSAEDLLRALGAEIGLGRAVGILVDERAKLRAVIGA